MGLVIEGNVSERMLVGAMLRAHAAARGGLKEKQAAGVGLLRRYLNENTARSDAWKRLSRLSPEVVIARASLAEVDLTAAGRLLEAATEVEQRRALLGQVIGPHYARSAMLFGEPIGERQSIPEVEASELEPALQPQLPAQELVMVAHPDGQGQLISQDQITNGQYEIFVDQTGHRVPYYWDDANLGRQNPTAAVVGVDYSTDAVGFSGWLGRKVPTEAAFLTAEQAY